LTRFGLLQRDALCKIIASTGTWKTETNLIIFYKVVPYLVCSLQYHPQKNKKYVAIRTILYHNKNQGLPGWT
jgi:hypothetical protein